MGIINRSRGRLTPGSAHLRSEPWIVAALGSALGAGGGGIPWEELAADYDRIRDRIGRVVPGCEDYTRRVRSAPFTLPNPVRDRREWRTPNGKANFLPARIPPDWEYLRARSAAGGPTEHVMMTIRTHDQFNTTVYGLDDRLRGVFGGRRVVFMHEEDIRAAGLAAGHRVDLVNRHGGVERVAPGFLVAPYRIPRGCVATYFPEANVLVPLDSVAAGSNTPTSKFVVVSVRPSATETVPDEGTHGTGRGSDGSS